MGRNTLQLTILLVLVTALPSGCAPIQPFRTTLEDCVQDLRGERACETTSYYTVTDGHAKAALAIFEFDDQGYLMRPDLYRTNLDRIRDIHAQHGALMVLFAHGWKHNAHVEDSNLVEFEKLLLELNAGDRHICQDEPCARRKTVGVYLGWRGLSATVEPFKELSFWNRKARAQNLGRDGAARLFADLDVLRDRNQPEGTRDLNRFVIVGHSFGGAVVYSATQQRLMADQARPNRRGTVSRRVADLVILVNPAFEAARFNGIHRRAAETSFPAGHRPVLAVFTSKADSATRVAFPIGRRLSTLWDKYNPDYPDQGRANRTAIGHFQPFMTHNMAAYASTSGYQRTRAALMNKLCTWEDFQHGKTDSWSTDGVTLTRLPRMRKEGQYANPYMVVSVEKEVIANHNDIWQPAFRDFLYSLVAAQNFRKACRPAG